MIQSRLGVYISVLHGYRQQNNIENELRVHTEIHLFSSKF